MTTAQQPIRQGDALLWPIENLPEHLTPVPRVNGELRILEGESTGHNHAILDAEAELLTDEIERYLRVTAPVQMTHPDHGVVPIAPGYYIQVPQVQHTPEAIVRVAD